MHDEVLRVILRAKDDASDALDKVTGSLERQSGLLNKMLREMPFVTGRTGAALLAATVTTERFYDSLKDMGDQIGHSVADMEKLHVAATKFNMTVGDMTGLISRAQQAWINKNRAEEDALVIALKHFGLIVRASDIRGREIELVSKLADEFAKYGASVEKSAIILHAFGAEQEAFYRLVRAGGEDVRKAIAEAERLFTDEDIARLERYRVAFGGVRTAILLLTRIVAKIGTEAFAIMLEAIAKSIIWVAKLADRFVNLIRPLVTLFGHLWGLTFRIKIVTGVIVGLTVAILGWIAINVLWIWGIKSTIHLLALATAKVAALAKVTIWLNAIGNISVKVLWAKVAAFTVLVAKIIIAAVSIHTLARALLMLAEIIAHRLGLDDIARALGRWEARLARIGEWWKSLGKSGPKALDDTSRSMDNLLGKILRTQGALGGAVRALYNLPYMTMPLMDILRRGQSTAEGQMQQMQQLQRQQQTQEAYAGEIRGRGRPTPLIPFGLPALGKGLGRMLEEIFGKVKTWSMDGDGDVLEQTVLP